MSPDFGSGGFDIWVSGTWTSQLNDVSLRNDNGAGEEWSYLEWEEENTSDSTKAYVLVDILDSSDVVLRSNLSGSLQSGNLMKLDLSVYANVYNVDIKFKFKLFSKTLKPIVSNIILT